MRARCLFLVLSASLTAQSPILLKATRAGHMLVINDVFLNDLGPFRMGVDTGNESSLVRPEIAQRLGLQFVYAVEQVTLAGTRRLPVVRLDRVATGTLTERDVEAIVGDVRLKEVDGILGQSWLIRHNYLLDYRNRRVVIDGLPPDRSLSVALHSEDGRPMLAAKVDGEPAHMVLDSGTPVVVLFRCGERDLERSRLATNSGSVAAGETSTRIVLAGDHERHMRAVCVQSSQGSPGLLPTSAFSIVFVSNRDSLVRLRR